MNYVCVVYFVVVVLIVADWFLRGKYEYRGQTLRHQEVEEQLGRRASMVD